MLSFIVAAYVTLAGNREFAMDSRRTLTALAVARAVGTRARNVGILALARFRRRSPRARSERRVNVMLGEISLGLLVVEALSRWLPALMDPFLSPR